MLCIHGYAEDFHSGRTRSLAYEAVIWWVGLFEFTWNPQRTGLRNTGKIRNRRSQFEINWCTRVDWYIQIYNMTCPYVGRYTWLSFLKQFIEIGLKQFFFKKPKTILQILCLEIGKIRRHTWASQVTQLKNLSANAGDARNMSLILGLGDPLEEEMATHSNILA